jgi:hypothetical protein
MTHPFLTHHRQQIKHVWQNLSPEEYDAFLTNETAGSKSLLEQKLGKTIRYLAYPYGDYNKQVEAKAIAAGYEAIFTVADNPVHSTTNIFSVGRYIITQPIERNFPAYLHQSALGLAKADPEPGATISNPQPVITAVLTQMSADALDPASLETQLRDMGIVKHDFDPATNIVRIYPPRPLVQQVEFVNIRVKDARTGQIMVANWHFNYEPGAGAQFHAPIPTTAPATAPTASPSPATNAVPATETVDKNISGTALDRPTSPPAPTPAPTLPHTD